MSKRRLPTLATLARALQGGEVTARGLVEDCLRRIDAPYGQGAVVFISVDGEAALAAADRIDERRARGEALPPYAGIPVSVKDLFDVQGQVTRAGSLALAGPPAAADAGVVARLRSAGFVVIGRTNMTEFAFSGLGLNPHYGTPLSPWRDGADRIAGGSSSGAAASVAEGMAHAALGTDTGGSARIPAAFTGLVGFKPTAGRVSQDGVYPLAPSLDAVGWIARSVDCCRILDDLLSDTPEPASPSPTLGRVKLKAPSNIVGVGLDPEVADAFADALKRLEAAGAEIAGGDAPILDRAAALGARGLAPGEAFSLHRDLIDKAGDLYDPRVLERLKGGAAFDPEALAMVRADRARIASAFSEEMADCDAMILPTVAVVPPRLAELEADDDAYLRVNALVLRNTALFNILDGCAISLPIGMAGGPPVGLMLAAPRGQDGRLLALAATVEAALA